MKFFNSDFKLLHPIKTTIVLIPGKNLKNGIVEVVEYYLTNIHLNLIKKNDIKFILIMKNVAGFPS